MQFLIAVTMLVGLAAAAPVTEYLKVVVTKEFFPDSLVIYKGEHEIVNLYVPINGINFKEDADEGPNKKVVLFFAEADEVDGKRVDRGLYVFKDGVPKKILEHGRDAASADDYEKDVYLAAADGIYWYNYEENTAEKYGSVTDSVIGIAKETGTDVIYILAEDKQVYRVTEGGNKKEKVEEIKQAEQIVIDYENNLYYYDSDKQLYVYNDQDGVKKVEGAPQEAKKVQFLRPPVHTENAAPFVADDKAYVIYADGYAEVFNVEFAKDAKPSAFSLEAALMQYYAVDKKIYEFDLVGAWMNGIYGVIHEIFETYVQIVKMIVALNAFNWP